MLLFITRIIICIFDEILAQYMFRKNIKLQFILINIVLLLLVIIALFSIKHLKNNYNKEIEKTLNTASSSVQSAYHLWLENLKVDIELVANDPVVINFTEKLLTYPLDSSILINNNTQTELRKYLNPFLKIHDYIGFFIISTENYVSYGSMRNSNIGTKNLISKDYPDLFDKAKKGEFFVVPPIASDVPLNNKNNFEKELTMFIGSPIKNKKGKIIAILTFRINPLKDFSNIAKFGTIGNSGETYVIDKNGFIVTQSRFLKKLKQDSLQVHISNSETFKVTNPSSNKFKENSIKIKNQYLPLTLAAKNVLNKETNINTEGYFNYLGTEVIGFWTWDEILQLGFITEINVSEALNPFYKSRNIVLFMLIVTIILVLLLSYLIIKLAKKHRLKLVKINESLETKVHERTLELQEINATKDKFFSIIAHDLANPFNYLIGMTDFLSENIETVDAETRDELILKLNDSATSAFDLLSNLLVWARSQQKMIKISPKNYNLKELTDTSIKPLINIAKEKNIQLLNKIQLNKDVYIDQYMVSTVIRNLVNNAIKFTNYNGIIEIEAIKNENIVTISVKDNGVGMSEEIQSKIFKIGEKVSTHGTNNESGTGLGLILCNEFISKNNGKIWVESIVGIGSTFYFTVPSA